MDKRHEYRVAVGSGVGLALLGIFLPYVWHEMPNFLSFPAILMGLTLVMWGVWPPIKDRFWPVRALSDSPEPSNPLTLREHFDRDFTHGGLRGFNTLNVVSPDQTYIVTIPSALYLDFDAGADFLCLYVPTCPRPYEVLEALSEEIHKTRDKLKGDIPVEIRRAADIGAFHSKELIFTGRVFIYHEDSLSLEQLGTLTTLYKKNGVTPIFRGRDYAGKKWLQRRVDTRGRS